MDQRPALVVFSGGVGGSPVEELVAAARTAAGLDNLERALATGAFAGGLFVTDRPEDAAGAPAGVEVVRSPEPFHFGEALVELIARRGIERIVYFGAGAVPLLAADELAGVAERLAGSPVVISNNYYSADLIAFAPAGTISSVPLPASDNPLARLLHEHAGLVSEPLPRTIATQLDIDTPTTLAILQYAGGTGPRLSAVLCRAELPVERFRQAARVFVERDRQALVAGRVGSHAWQFLERETACRVRLFAEERGMQADGREEGGKVRSLLGMYLDLVGVDRFFAALAELGDAAFIDTRVLTAHARRFPHRHDRFLSDLDRWQEVEDPFLRDLTRGAVEAPIPVLLGGHALISGGLMALVQAAWDERDREIAAVAGSG
ncbi:MAG: hypothetical protein HYX51_02870 [Chloroflexi bacterium]|nr:hypothetical protein [Chloroflexota bacterium]